jgi:hypothetical protein
VSITPYFLLAAATAACPEPEKPLIPISCPAMFQPEHPSEPPPSAMRSVVFEIEVTQSGHVQRVDVACSPSLSRLLVKAVSAELHECVFPATGSAHTGRIVVPLHEHLSQTSLDDGN